MATRTRRSPRSRKPKTSTRSAGRRARASAKASTQARTADPRVDDASVDDDPRPRVRVAIIGGGCAGMGAAWHLAKHPDFEVSVFEQSSRLGGKGASQRAPDGRILEHGLHVWLGFYENAFRMVRECYEEVERRGWGPTAKDREHRLAHDSFDSAFFPEPHIGVTGRNAGQDVTWTGFLPPEKGLPGDPIDADSNPFTLASYLLRCVHLLKTLMLSAIGPPEEDVPGPARPDSRSALDQRVDLDFSIDPTRSPELLIQSVASRVRNGSLTLAAAMLQAVTILENILQDLNHSPQAVGSVLNVMKALAGQARKQLADVVRIDERLRWKTEIIDIVMTIAVGLYRDRVLLSEKGLDALNDLDYRDWLFKHGATKTSLKSPFITGIYDLVFAYEGGDAGRPRLAAGVALRGALRMFFTYRGAMFWRMRSGMGDAVFAPLYRVLSQSDRRDPRSGRPLAPVRFHFLHELSKVAFEFPAKGRGFLTELTFDVPNGGLAVGDRGSDALDHMGCWPGDAEGRRSSARAAGEKRTLRVGADFDFVIFATGRDQFKALMDASERGKRELPRRWQNALASPRQTVGTKAAQVWLSRDLEQIGWYRGSAIISALNLPFSTWADMTHTLAAERKWRRAKGAKSAALDRARSVAYFCGVVSEKPGGEEPDERSLQADVADQLAGMPVVWSALKPREIDDAVIAIHVQSNVAGSDRYSVSLPGTINNRISPLDNSVLNVSVAGDWTACGLDAGCVEAAVMSGMLAAHAMTGGQPALDTIIGYDHP